MFVWDTAGCSIWPHFKVHGFSGDIDIGAWFICHNGYKAGLECDEGTLVNSGFDHLCDAYPCCISNGTSSVEEVRMAPDCPYTTDDSGYAKVKVYRYSGSCDSYYISIVETKGKNPELEKLKEK